MNTTTTTGVAAFEEEHHHHHHHHQHQHKMKKKSIGDNQLREIEVLIISAQDLKNVKHITKMRAYAVVYVEREVHVAKTRVDEEGGVNPTWNEVVKVKFHEKLLKEETSGHVMAALNVDIYAHGHVREKPVGSARVLLCDVLKPDGDASDPLDNPIQCLTIRVWRESGRPQGFLNLWVPPAGRFLVRRDSLSFSVKEPADEEEVAAAESEAMETVEDEKKVGELSV